MVQKLHRNWKQCKVSDISQIIRGVSYSKSDAKATKGKSDYLILRGGNIQDGQIVMNSDEVFVDGKYVSDQQKILKGDVIIVGSTGSEKLIGKAAVALENLEGISFGAFLMLIRPNEKVEKKFFDYYFLSDAYRGTIRSLAGGVNINNIRKEYIENLEFPLPPLEDQKRIVQKLDKLFAHLEKIKERLDQIPELLKQFRQSVLTQAVTGKLTEEFPEESTIKRIEDDKINYWKNELKIGNIKKLPKNKNTLKEESIVRLKKVLAKSYDVACFDQISANKMNALKAGPFGSSLKKEYYAPKGYKVYGQEQVIKDDPNYGDYFIDEHRFNILKSCAIETNDILVSLVGTIGKVLVIPENHQKGIINPRLVKVSLHQNINPFFIKYYLQSEFAIKFLSENSHGGTMDVLNLGILRQLPIPIPNKEEQNRIVNIIDDLFSRADKIEQRYKKLKEQLDQLQPALLAKAFRGELG